MGRTAVPGRTLDLRPARVGREPRRRTCEHPRRTAPSHPALVQHAEDRAQNIQNRIADMITRFAGSMMFVYVHVIWFGAWIIFAVEHYPFGLLTMIVSLEAIFPSAFVMISQNRADEKRRLLADHRWQIVGEEEQQDEQVLHISTKSWNSPGRSTWSPRHASRAHEPQGGHDKRTTTRQEASTGQQRRSRTRPQAPQGGSIRTLASPCVPTMWCPGLRDPLQPSRYSQGPGPSVQAKLGLEMGHRHGMVAARADGRSGRFSCPLGRSGTAPRRPDTDTAPASHPLPIRRRLP
jgi:hypothetical protein